MKQMEIWKQAYVTLTGDPEAKLIGLTQVPEGSTVTQDELAAEVKRIEGILNAPRKLTYADHRRSLYPNVSEQLDMLWHDIHNGVITVNGRSQFFDKIKSIKEKYPKEGQ